jgi:hypothetical protein
MVACLQFRKRVPSSASAADVATNRKIEQRMNNAPFNVMSFVASGFHPMKKMATCMTVGIGFGEVRHVQVYV